MEAIKAHSLVKRYQSLTAVDGLDLEIRQGELFSLLGVNGAVVKAHGSSGPEAIENAVRQARRMLEGDVVGKISAGLKNMEEA